MMVSLLILMITFQLCVVSVDSTPIFSFRQPATGPSSVCKGSNVTLQCVVVRSFDNTTTVRDTVWIRNINGMITTITTQLPIPNHRLVFNSTNDAFTDLEITNVTMEDNNTSCNCSAAGANIISIVVLNVTDPLGMLTLNEICKVHSCEISWSSPAAQSVCKTISYDITLSEAHDNGSFGMLPPILTDITITHYNFTNLTSNTSYLIGIIPKYNGLEGNMSSLIVRTKPDQPSSILISSTNESGVVSPTSTQAATTYTPTISATMNSNESSSTVIIIIPVIVVIIIITTLAIAIILISLRWRKVHKKGIKPNESESKENDYAQPNGNGPQQEKNNEDYAYAQNGPRGIVFPAKKPQQQ